MELPELSALNGIWLFKKTMGNVYLSLIRNSQDTYGISNVFAYLLDFDNDGKDELILCDGENKRKTKNYSYLYGKTNLIYDKQSFIPEAGYWLAVYEKNSMYYILEGVTGSQCFEDTYGMIDNTFKKVGSYTFRIVKESSGYIQKETRSGTNFAFDTDNAYMKINLQFSNTSSTTNETINKLINMR